MDKLLVHTRRPDISIHPNGRIDISACAARRLALAPGDVIGIARDGGELYLYVKLRAGKYVGCHAGVVWAVNKGRGSFRAHSKALARAVLSAARAAGPLRCPCGAEMERDGTEYISIISRASIAPANPSPAAFACQSPKHSP